MRARALTRAALLTAAALIISYLESLLPLGAVIPIPGIKLGLASIVTLYALYKEGTVSALFIVVCRVALSALLFGSPISFIYAISGGLLAFFVMLFAKKVGAFSLFGVSIAGAAAHQVGQIAAACVLLRSGTVFYYLTALLPVAILTGLLTGFCFMMIKDRI